MSQHTSEIQVGTKVSYEDMANPLRDGEVTEIVVSEWGTQYRVAWDDGGETVSDLRQRGWKEQS